MDDLLPYSDEFPSVESLGRSDAGTNDEVETGIRGIYETDEYVRAMVSKEIVRKLFGVHHLRTDDVLR
jgi:hypothetical protein